MGNDHADDAATAAAVDDGGCFVYFYSSRGKWKNMIFTPASYYGKFYCAKLLSLSFLYRIREL